jgi:hypothetical protein
MVIIICAGENMRVIDLDLGSADAVAEDLRVLAVEDKALATEDPAEPRFNTIVEVCTGGLSVVGVRPIIAVFCGESVKTTDVLASSTDCGSVGKVVGGSDW